MTNSTHYKVVCEEHNVTYEQCRCPSPDKTVRKVPCRCTHLTPTPTDPVPLRSAPLDNPPEATTTLVIAHETEPGSVWDAMRYLVGELKITVSVLNPGWPQYGWSLVHFSGPLEHIYEVHRRHRKNPQFPDEDLIADLPPPTADSDTEDRCPTCANSGWVGSRTDPKDCPTCGRKPYWLVGDGTYPSPAPDADTATQEDS